jgi:hypothetical protein
MPSGMEYVVLDEDQPGAKEICLGTRLFYFFELVDAGSLSCQART